DATASVAQSAQPVTRGRNLQVVESLVAEPTYELISPGIYEAVGGRGHIKRMRMFGGAPKFRVLFDVLVPDDVPDGHRIVTLLRSYNVRVLSSSRFTAPRMSDCRREITIALDRKLRAHEHLALNTFNRVLFRVEVRTVMHDPQHRDLHALN